MKLSKKALTAMIAVSIAATALPAAAMIGNLSSTLTSGNSSTNNAVPVTNADEAEGGAQTAASAPAVQATPSPESMFEVKDVEGGVAIIGFKTDDANFTDKVVIPPTIGGKTVVSLEPGFFTMNNAQQITSLDTSNCTSLSLGLGIFYDCTNLQSVDLSGVTSVGEQSFMSCTNLKGSLNLTKCTTIGKKAFYGCSSINSVTLSNKPSIPDQCFSGCTNLSTFNSSTSGQFDLSGFTSIGTDAFSGCGVRSVTWSSNIPTIPVACFASCTNLQSINMPSVTSIEKKAFYNCSNLTSIDLTNVTSIGYSAFYNAGLTGSIDLSHCTYLDPTENYPFKGIFENCKNITSVKLPADTAVPAQCFKGCTSLSSLNSTTPGQFDFTTGIASVGKNAFEGNEAVTSVKWSTGVAIPDGCFKNCTKLSTFNSDTPGQFNLAGITSIGSLAFDNCKAISGTIDLSSCTTVGSFAFRYTGITSVKWSGSMKNIPQACFLGCTALQSFNSDTPWVCDLTGITEIGQNAFLQSAFSSVIFPSEDYTIDTGAFQNNKNLGKVNLEHCTSIGTNAFFGCEKLEPVVYTTTKSIAQNAFKDIGSYVTIHANSVDDLGTYCASIAADSGNLKGLADVKKVAEIPGTTDATGLLYDASNLAADANATYYLDTSINSEFGIDHYKTEAAYDVTLKSIANGSSEATAVDSPDSVTFFFQIPTDQYDSTKNYYLVSEINGESSAPIIVDIQSDNDCYIASGNTNRSLSATDKNTVALLSQSPVSNITISGEKTFTYGASSPTYTATVTPADAKQAVTWSSSNPNVLKFEDENSGTATIVGAGEATVTATATDGSGVNGTLDITVGKATPIITLADAFRPYTGSPIEMDGAEVTLVNNETYTGEVTYNYYSDAECQNRLDGAPTDTGTYYVKASTREQANYLEVTSDPATLTITPIDMSGVSADGFDGKYDGQPHSITVTGQLEGATVQYYEGDYSTVEDPATITWVDENPAYTDVCNCTVSYKVTDPNGNYNEAKGSATINISQADVPVPTAAPELDSKTVDSVTLKTVEGGTTEQGAAYSVEYGIQNGTGEIAWQDTNIFTGLERGTDYTFYIRNHITDTSKVANYTENGYSSASQGVKITTEDVTPPATDEGFTIDYVNETITLGAGYEAATDASFAEGTTLKSGDKITPGSTVYVRYAATADNPVSAGTENKIADRPAAPAAKPEITQTAKMVQVTNGADGQEYKFHKETTNTNLAATFDVWQDSPVLIDDSMTDDAIYTVTTRVKATDTTFASEEINNTYQAQNTPKDGVRLDGGSAGIEWENKTDTSDTKKYGADTPYEIPFYLKTSGGDTYMVEIDWGDMLFSYNFGTWDTETLSYDDPSQQGWTTSFDGVNNQVTVINRSSNDINSTIGLTIDTDKQAELEHLGFHLTSDNKNSEDSNDYYPTEAKTLQSGSTGNSTTAYVNIKSDDTKPDDSIANKYNQIADGTEFGKITVTVQKTN